MTKKYKFQSPIIKYYSKVSSKIIIKTSSKFLKLAKIISFNFASRMRPKFKLIWSKNHQWNFLQLKINFPILKILENNFYSFFISSFYGDLWTLNDSFFSFCFFYIRKIYKILFLLKSMFRNVAIYGGSFDPPHKSHIALARYLKKLSFID